MPNYVVNKKDETQIERKVDQVLIYNKMSSVQLEACDGAIMS